VLYWLQNTAAKFEDDRNDSNWETLAQCRKIACICTFFKVYPGEWEWWAVSDRLQKPCYLYRVDHDRKVMGRKQRTEVGKYSFVNGTIPLWKQLP
jgi:hypothetical protein